MKTPKILFLNIVMAVCTLGQTAPQTAAPDDRRPIVVQNMYWAKPAKAEEVYQWRLHASDVRVKLGLLQGRVLRRQGDSESLPDVIWECDYPSAAARAKELAILDKSEEFTEVQKHMSTLITKFDRAVWQLQ